MLYLFFLSKVFVVEVGGFIWVLLFELKAEVAATDDGLAFEGEVVGGATVAVYGEVHHHLAIGRC